MEGVASNLFPMVGTEGKGTKKIGFEVTRQIGEFTLVRCSFHPAYLISMMCSWAHKFGR